LESYAKQVEEFQHFGNLEDLSKYLKRAQALDAKLQAASDKADKFNKEEEMFEWEVTNYPLRKQVHMSCHILHCIIFTK
jgi:dynein heavy chain